MIETNKQAQKAIETIMAETGWKPCRVAAKAGLAAHTILNILSDKSQISEATAAKLSELLARVEAME